MSGEGERLVGRVHMQNRQLETPSMGSEGKRYETTVHDKRTGQPVRGCDDDAVAEVERLREVVKRADFMVGEVAEGIGWHRPVKNITLQDIRQELRAALSPDDSRN